MDLDRQTDRDGWMDLDRETVRQTNRDGWMDGFRQTDR